MRRVASLAGISNPYLSQIERGLRAPSDRVVSAIATALNSSADALYEQAKMDPPTVEGAESVERAIQNDPNLTPRQRQALLDVYRAFIGKATPDQRGKRPRANKATGSR